MITLQVPTARTVAKTLGSQEVKLHDSYDIKARLNGSTLEVVERGEKVFWINITSEGDCLVLDRAETLLAQRGRGLGTLGLLLALTTGESKGKKNVKLGTNIEPAAYGFWCGMRVNPIALVTAKINVYTKITTPRPSQPLSKAEQRKAEFAALMKPIPKTLPKPEELKASFSALKQKADVLTLADWKT